MFILPSPILASIFPFTFSLAVLSFVLFTSVHIFSPFSPEISSSPAALTCPTRPRPLICHSDTTTDSAHLLSFPGAWRFNLWTTNQLTNTNPYYPTWTLAMPLSQQTWDNDEKRRDKISNITSSYERPTVDLFFSLIREPVWSDFIFISPKESLNDKLSKLNNFWSQHDHK